MFLGSHEESIRHLKKAGFRYIDLSFYTASDMKEFMCDNWREKAHILKELAAELEVEFVQAHTPGTANPFIYDENRENLIKLTARSIEVCEVLGIKNAVIHTGVREGLEKEAYFEESKCFLQTFYPLLEKTGVNLLVENSTRANLHEKYFFYTGADMKDFISYIANPFIHACWDTGHANCEGHQYTDILTLGDDLRALHINDNRGLRDEHLVPYNGTVCMDEVMTALREIHYDGFFTFECPETLVREESWPFPKRRFGEKRPLKEPPLFAYDAIEKLLYDMGKYILETYDCFEE